VQKLVITARTQLFETGDVVRIAVDYGDDWRRLSLQQSTDGRKAQCEFDDAVRQVRVMTRVKGPAYGKVEIWGLLPSQRNNLAIRLTIEPERANTWINAYGDFQW
jgi:hypothetical protein